MEDLVDELAFADAQLVGAQIAEVALLHDAATTWVCRSRTWVGTDSLAAASFSAALAATGSTPSISKRIRPGFTTATQISGDPLPLPMRVPAGFLVSGLSGNTRTQTRPPRLIARVSATRAASISRAVSQARSTHCSPKSPKARELPRHAVPPRRPFCCFRHLTFLGASMGFRDALDAERRALLLLLTRENLAPEDPDLDADDAVRGAGLREAVVEVRAQRVQRHASLAVPLRAGDLRAAEPPCRLDADALRAHAHGAGDGLLHGTPERHAPLELESDVFGDELGVDVGPAHLVDVDEG